MIEGNSKKSDQDWVGRSETNHTVIFPKEGMYQKGDYVAVKIERSTQTSLIGKAIDRYRF